MLDATQQTGDDGRARRTCSSLRVRVPGHVVYREFPEQAVVLNLQSGQYHCLNKSGSVMFELLASGAAATTVAQTVSRRYRISPAAAESDVSSLCVSLLERGLVEPLERGRG